MSRRAREFSFSRHAFESAWNYLSDCALRRSFIRLHTSLFSTFFILFRSKVTLDFLSHLFSDDFFQLLLRGEFHSLDGTECFQQFRGPLLTDPFDQVQFSDQDAFCPSRSMKSICEPMCLVPQGLYSRNEADVRGS